MRKATVARQQHRVEPFGEGHVDGVVRAQVVAKRPHPIEERLVGVALQVKGAKVLEGVVVALGASLRATVRRRWRSTEGRLVRPESLGPTHS